MKTRRYVPNGRPSRTGAEPVNFDSKKKVFSVGDQLQGQEIKVGEGTREVERGSLVRAQWVISLADGYIVDDTTSTGSVVFRVGVGQVATGIEGAVIGMKTGGSRVVKGPADVFFSYVPHLFFPCRRVFELSTNSTSVLSANAQGHHFRRANFSPKGQRNIYGHSSSTNRSLR